MLCAAESTVCEYGTGNGPIKQLACAGVSGAFGDRTSEIGQERRRRADGSTIEHFSGQIVPGMAGIVLTHEFFTSRAQSAEGGKKPALGEEQDNKAGGCMRGPMAVTA